MSESFARRLKTERETKGWTQSFLANLIGVSNGTISGYERNYREPDIETITKLADAFEVSVDFLLGKTNLRTSDMLHIAESKVEYKIRAGGEPDQSLADLPEEAQKAIAEFISFIKEKYRTK